MAFDKNNAGPIVQPAKKTTKVNISLIIGVIVFLGIGLAGLLWMRSVHG